MTFSLIARSPDAQTFGMVIASSSPAVAARCAHARTGAGVVATQNITDPALGPQILRALSGGATAEAALSAALKATAHAAYRQVLVLGRSGPPAVHTGAEALGVTGTAVGIDSAAAGNLLARSDVPSAMVAAFESASGHFGARLLEALRAGAQRGGEAGPVHSAGLLVVRELSWPIVDLRVDWHDADPIAALDCVWKIYAPQIDDYIRRALDPGGAPGFGVPGNPMRAPGGPVPDADE
ncbi:MAG: hypothetical protein JWN43_4367 [Gammaproteobacteria bacterium]|nr:hypothetical protein [Gammaproteobacteria bacterium]